MKMKRCIVVTIMLMLSLEAAVLVAGRPSIIGDVGTILLPSQAKGGGALKGGRRPWKCCDQPICRGSTYIVCECADEVDECAPTCKSCVASKGNASRKVCEDFYIGKAGPACSAMPWKCCDNPFCSGEDPPTCHCSDQVEQCDAACKTCLPVIGQSSRHICFDLIHSFPGPECKYLVAAGDN